MRKSFLLPLCLILGVLFSGFTSKTHPETFEVIQKSLKTKQLERVFEKDEQGKFLPLLLITNDLIEDNIPVYLKGKQVQVAASLSNLNENQKALILTNLKISGKKSSLEMLYGKKEVKIKLRKYEGQWHYRSILIKEGKGHFYLDVNSVK